MAGTFSGHLIQRHEYPHQPSTLQTGGADEPVIAGAMSFNPKMHGVNIPPFLQSTPGPAADPNHSVAWLSQSFNHSFASGSASQFDISEATAMKIAELQAKLDRRLGPEYISTRPGPGGGPRLTYAEGWKVINLANEVFGFNGWSSSIVNLTTDYCDFQEDGKRWNVGVTCVMRVTLRDGCYHEDVGYGMLENSKSKGAALDKCKKEAVTDGVKRTLRNFGNLLGNCLYDKNYVKEVSKVPVPQPKFDKSSLHRHPDLAEKPIVNASAAMMASANAGPTNTSTTATASTSSNRGNMAPPQQHRPQPQPPQPRTDQPPPAPVPAKRPPPPQNRPSPPTGLDTTTSAVTTSGPVQPTASTSDEELYPFGSQDDALFDQVDVSTLGGMDVDVEAEADLGQPIYAETDDEGSAVTGGKAALSRSTSMGNTHIKPVSAPARTSTPAAIAGVSGASTEQTFAPPQPPAQGASSGQGHVQQTKPDKKGLATAQSAEAKARRLQMMEQAMRVKEEPTSSSAKPVPEGSSNAGTSSTRGATPSLGSNRGDSTGPGQQRAGSSVSRERSKPPPAGGFHFPPGVDMNTLRNGGVPGFSSSLVGVKRPLDQMSGSSASRRDPLSVLDVDDSGEVKRVRR